MSTATAKFPNMGSTKCIDSILFSMHMQVLSETDNHGAEDNKKKPRHYE